MIIFVEKQNIIEHSKIIFAIIGYFRWEIRKFKTIMFSFFYEKFVLGCPESSCRFSVSGISIDLNIYQNDWKQLTCVYILKGDVSDIFREKVWLGYIHFCKFYTLLNIEGNKVHYRHLMLFFYRKSKNATQVAKKIYAICGEDATVKITVLK